MAAARSASRDASAAFPAARIVRIDRDSARRRAELSRTLQGIQRGEADILVGTQLSAKGHDSPAYSRRLLNADARSSLPIPCAERLFAVLAQVAGRAGRRDQQGEVLVQTATPAPALRRAHAPRLSRLCASQLAERKSAGFPAVRVRALRAEATKLDTALRFLREAVRGCSRLAKCASSTRCRTSSRPRRLERAQLLMQSPPAGAAGLSRH